MMDERETKVGVLDKVMVILRAFPRGNVLLSPAEIAVRTNLPLPTVYRLAQALCEHGMLERDGQRFRLGLTLMQLGGLVAEGIDLRGQVIPHLKWLNERTGENAELHVRHGNIRVPVELIRSSQNLRPFVDIGAQLPLHVGASGKVLLAWLPPAERAALAQASATHFGEESFDTLALHRQLEQVRAEGWVASDGERSPGVAAIAAPIFNAAGFVVAALTLTAPSLRMPPWQHQKFAPLVCEAATRASSDLGYRKYVPHYESEITEEKEEGSA